MRWFFVSLLFFVSLASAQEAYYPSRDGLTWTYSNGETQILSGSKDVSGQAASVLIKMYEGVAISEDYLVYDAGGQGVQMVGTAANGQLLAYTAPLQLYPNSPLQVGQTWRSKASVSGMEIALAGEVLGVRGVETAAGRFNALQIRQQTVTSTGGQTIIEIFFVPSVGIVRFLMQDGTAVDLIEKNF
ncbi:MAG: hypothetical protein ACRCYY_02675 [Trueperaceae bacterium]